MKLTAYIYANISTYSVRTNITEYDYWKIDTDPSNPKLRVMDHASFLLLQTLELEVDLPEYDPITLQVRGLEATLQKNIADSYLRQNDLKAKIQELQCIGNDKPEEEGQSPCFFDDDFPI